jgi:uncharacterized protein YcfJ
MRRNIMGLFALSILVMGASTADAGCQGRKTTGTVLGAAGGGVLGNVITHGSAVGTVVGAVGGGLVGHSIAASNCRSHYYSHHGRRGYYDRYHHWHYV